MCDQTASIRQLRTDFRFIKRKIEEHGQVVITDNGAPAYVLTALPRVPAKPVGVPDYYARLLKRQPKPLSEEQTRLFWEDERGSR